MKKIKKQLRYLYLHREAIIGIAMICVLAIAAIILAEIFVEHFIK